MRWLLALVVLAGCATRSPETVEVKWIRVSQDEVHTRCAEHQGHNPTVIGHNQACALFNRDVGYCVIYAVDYTEKLGMSAESNRRERALMASLGHELKHCFDGPWH